MAGFGSASNTEPVERPGGPGVPVELVRVGSSLPGVPVVAVLCVVVVVLAGLALGVVWS
jgi:hypothetical protein